MQDKIQMVYDLPSFQFKDRAGQMIAVHCFGYTSTLSFIAASHMP